jgi:hypothetical protein
VAGKIFIQPDMHRENPAFVSVRDIFGGTSARNTSTGGTDAAQQGREMSMNNSHQVADKLWRISEDLLGLDHSDVLDDAVEHLCQIAYKLRTEALNEGVYLTPVRASCAE